MINQNKLDKLEENLDNALEKETSESLTEWMNQKRLTQKLREPKTEEHKQNISKAKQNISQETKQRISEGKKGKTPNRDYKTWAKQQQKPVLQYDLEGNFIKEWEGIKVAAAYLGCDPTTITANLRGITKKGYGYIWKRKTI